MLRRRQTFEGDQARIGRGCDERVEPKRLQLEHALGLRPGAVQVASAKDITRDAVLLYCAKADDGARA